MGELVRKMAHARRVHLPAAQPILPGNILSVNFCISDSLKVFGSRDFPQLFCTGFIRNISQHSCSLAIRTLNIVFVSSSLSSAGFVVMGKVSVISNQFKSILSIPWAPVSSGLVKCIGSPL
ncbi:hypothetical protein CEXT_483181 [Caerostris extrusa]|uniref:Uncharacterized protein n=1 Tax=Caerostris extrusa TaxID=172846 RepID=A0AAV4Y6A9_CAEEX|nr:hypothetical protein CEXT_483181 [Caerostris extrusa]